MTVVIKNRIQNHFVCIQKEYVLYQKEVNTKMTLAKNPDW